MAGQGRAGQGLKLVMVCDVMVGAELYIDSKDGDETTNPMFTLVNGEYGACMFASNRPIALLSCTGVFCPRLVHAADENFLNCDL